MQYLECIKEVSVDGGSISMKRLCQVRGCCYGRCRWKKGEVGLGGVGRPCQELGWSELARTRTVKKEGTADSLLSTC